MQDTQPVILVDEHDRELGTMEKMQAHREGVLHRAISVIVLNSKGEMLLQRRANEKYHSGGLWSNACCSHPKPGEDTQAAAQRRLEEEMGFTCELTALFTMTYKAAVGNGLTEHEYDHFFIGYWDEPVEPNAQEVQGHKFVTLEEIDKLLSQTPEAFTVWFRDAYPKFKAYLKTQEAVK